MTQRKRAVPLKWLFVTASSELRRTGERSTNYRFSGRRMPALARGV
jgi:hypothetical protein